MTESREVTVAAVSRREQSPDDRPVNRTITHTKKEEHDMAPKTPKNSGKAWSAADQKTLRTLAAGNTPTRVIGLKMDRSEAAIRNQAAKQKTSLKPTNQSPYGTKKKK